MVESYFIIYNGKASPTKSIVGSMRQSCFVHSSTLASTSYIAISGRRTSCWTTWVTWPSVFTKLALGMAIDPMPFPAFCGTPEYIAPELLESQGHTKTMDTWRSVIRDDGENILSLNNTCQFICQTGLPPFYDENVNTMYQRTLIDPLAFPSGISGEAKSVMTGLLQRDPTRRLGANGGEEIKKHPFFAKYIDWNLLLQKRYNHRLNPAWNRCSTLPTLIPTYKRRSPRFGGGGLSLVGDGPRSIQRVHVQPSQRAPQRKRQLWSRHGVISQARILYARWSSLS
ncbi:hypothetical protein L210DRAFT_3532358 [Boletus edulis BED1]|uniref:cAMP-dependent protein kinase n=1 Tax=Boletus edulis BED1 TaxID=1328754 RepID=A0AAD4BZ84_BOLED|nr:hypothetical protein L210DRAFT_3532358 [Boletus edulis BED1]